MNSPPFLLEEQSMEKTGQDGPPITAGSKVRPFLFLCVILFSIYGNTFNAEWHLDDRHSILENPKVHLTELTPQTLVRSMQHPDKKTYWRPLAYMSFALNWYAGQKTVFGYHLVNLTIHFLAAGFLFLTIMTLFQTPALRGKNRDTAYFIGLFATVLWATNPIQTQAVTYIVQRMTLLAALFSILGIYCYLKARLTGNRRHRFMLLCGCLASFLLGLSSKEIAVLLPLNLILLEAVFFQDLGNAQTRNRFLSGFLISCVTIGILGSVLFLHGNLLSVFGGYGDRYFTPMERLMTQPRVLVFYLTQILCPLPARLSIEHDIDLSTALLQPWTTLPAIVFVVAVIIGALFQIRKRPLLSFAILFFFLNHLVESSIVPLEMVFEHRNYLPSMFLFVPVAEGTVWLLDRYREKQPILYRGLIGLAVCLMIGFGWGTYVRNSVWQTEVSLWTDANRKAPLLHRPIHNLAMAKYESSGQLEKALELYKKAVDMKMHRRSHKARVYGNIANIYFRLGRFELAEAYYQKAYDTAPFIADNRYRLAETLSRRQKWPSALFHIDALLSKNPHNHDYLNLKGTFLLQQGKAIAALGCFRAAIRNNPKGPEGYVKAGSALMAINAYDRAETLFRYALGLAPNSLKTYLRLIDANLRSGDQMEAQLLLEHLMSAASIVDIEASLNEFALEPFSDPIGNENLKQAISSMLKRHIYDASPEALQPLTGNPSIGKRAAVGTK